MKGIHLFGKALGVLSLFIGSTLQAGTPVWTFTPLSKTNVSVSATSSATINYRVTNQSSRLHTLVMNPIVGVTQTTTGANVCRSPFILPGRASCILSLQVNGRQLPGNVSGGPVVCQQGNQNQCYQPSLVNILQIIKTATPVKPVNKYTIGGRVQGLQGELVLQNNNQEIVELTTNGAFTFPTPLPSGSNYRVVVKAKPAAQTCTVSNGTGKVGNKNVTNIKIVCSSNTYTIGGQITGLSADGLILQNNGANDLGVANGQTSFQFSIPVAHGGGYNVTVAQQPLNQTCTVNNGSGTNVTANITNILVSCNLNLVYVTNSNAGNVSRCTLDINNNLTNCTTSGAGIEAPYGITLNSTATLAYVVSRSGSNVSKCGFDGNGNLSSCTPTGNGMSIPYGIAINAAQTLAYVTNVNNNTVSKCQIDENGDFSNCTPTGNGLDMPAGMVLNSAGTFAYIVNENGGTNRISKCTIDANGDLSGCTLTGSSFFNPTGIIFNSAQTFAYISNFNTSQVTKCNIDSLGELTGCIFTGSGLGNQRGLTVNVDETVAYITDQIGNSVSKCTIDTTNSPTKGDLINCSLAASGLNGPVGIVIGSPG